MHSQAVAIVLVVLCCVCHGYDTHGFTVSKPKGFTQLDTSQASTLYRIEADEYDPKPYLLVLKGSRYQIGYDYGYMLAEEIVQVYNTFMNYVIGQEIEILALEAFLDWQWDEYLSVNLPNDYKEELRGVSAGGKAKGYEDLDIHIIRTAVIANFPGDIEENIEWLLYSEIFGYPTPSQHRSRELFEAAREPLRKLQGMHCSMFAVWGNRTKNRQLYSMRNLDWDDNTGINEFKLITIYKPNNAIAHATYGFVGVMGALAGMSSQGITVHEAGLNVKKETFNGFPWLWRLRYIMEQATTISEALKLWEDTPNTVGMNHLISSSNDAEAGNPHPAYIEEVMAEYTAYFHDDDPREKELTYTNKDGQKVHIGAPLKEAVWRTNNAYDPKIVAMETDANIMKRGTDSVMRYMIMSESFQYYEKAKIEIGVTEAINVTSIVAGKGGLHFFECLDEHTGSNILSVTFVPKAKAGMSYVAWAKGRNDSWRPACCGTYLEIDMTPWWSA